MTAALSPDGSTPGLVRSTTVLAVAQVAGFVASTPGGLGVRELLLQQMLAPYTGDREAVVLAVLLRLLWTVAELVMAAVVWWLPAKQPEPLANAQAL